MKIDNTNINNDDDDGVSSNNNQDSSSNIYYEHCYFNVLINYDNYRIIT